MYHAYNPSLRAEPGGLRLGQAWTTSVSSVQELGCCSMAESLPDIYKPWVQSTGLKQRRGRRGEGSATISEPWKAMSCTGPGPQSLSSKWHQRGYHHGLGWWLGDQTGAAHTLRTPLTLLRGVIILSLATHLKELSPRQ